MDAEIQTLTENDTLGMVHLPSNVSIIGKWFYSLKLN